MHPVCKRVRLALIAGVAGSVLAAAPAFAQKASTTDLEKRIQALEAALNAVKAELDAAKTQAQAAQQAAAQSQAQSQAQTAAAADKAAETKTFASRLEAIEKKAATVTDGFKVGNTTVRINGYVKLDVLASRFSGGDPAANTLVNDYYFPAQIPVGGVSEGFNVTTSVRETRFSFRTETPVGETALTSHLELDFFDTNTGGNQRISNSFVPRVRRAFVSYGGWTLGQDWSTFQNPSALPERLDFVGPTEGTVFERQPLIRYKHGIFTFAIENPETTATLGTTSAEADDDVAPDFVARVDKKTKVGTFALAGIARVLKVDNSAAPVPFGTPGDIKGTEFGWGISASGVHDFGPSRITWMGTFGEGLGRYLGLNIRDDVVVSTAGDIDAPFMYSGFFSYRYAFTPKFKAVGTLSGFRSDTPDFASLSLTKSIWSANLDLLYNPWKPLSLGVGYRFAKRTLENSLDDTLNRLQFSAQYNF